MHTYVYDKVPHEFTLILPIQVKDYRVLNVTTSILTCVSFSMLRILVLKNIRIELEYPIVIRLVYLSLYTVSE